MDSRSYSRPGVHAIRSTPRHGVQRRKRPFRTTKCGKQVHPVPRQGRRAPLWRALRLQVAGGEDLWAGLGVW